MSFGWSAGAAGNGRDKRWSCVPDGLPEVGESPVEIPSDHVPSPHVKRQSPLDGNVVKTQVAIGAQPPDPSSSALPSARMTGILVTLIEIPQSIEESHEGVCWARLSAPLVPALGIQDPPGPRRRQRYAIPAT